MVRSGRKRVCKKRLALEEADRQTLGLARTSSPVPCADPTRISTFGFHNLLYSIGAQKSRIRGFYFLDPPGGCVCDTSDATYSWPNNANHKIVSRSLKIDNKSRTWILVFLLNMTWQLTTYYLVLSTYLLLTTHYSLLTTYYLLLTTYYLLLTTYYLLLTTYYLLLTRTRNSCLRMPSIWF